MHIRVELFLACIKIERTLIQKRKVFHGGEAGGRGAVPADSSAAGAGGAGEGVGAGRGGAGQDWSV